MNKKLIIGHIIFIMCLNISYAQWCENLDQSDKQIISNVIYEKLLKHKDSLAFRKNISSGCLTKFNNDKVKFYTANDIYSKCIDDFLDVEFIAFENLIARVIITNHKLNTIYNFNFKKVESRWQLLNESDYLIQGRLKYVDFLYEQVKEKKN